MSNTSNLRHPSLYVDVAGPWSMLTAASRRIGSPLPALWAWARKHRSSDRAIGHSSRWCRSGAAGSVATTRRPQSASASCAKRLTRVVRCSRARREPGGGDEPCRT
jgi:hypothetical protein